MLPNIVYCSERNSWNSTVPYHFHPEPLFAMYTSLIRPLLFQLDPEKAHFVTTILGNALCSIPFAGPRLVQRHAQKWPQLEQELAGITFSNPVGIAAGFDKNGNYTDLLRFLGFGFAEYGSITALPSPGNPRPRLFRLKKDRALINRMGLNNAGAEAICHGIMRQQRQRPELFNGFPGGINIAKTHDPDITGEDAIQDYITSYRLAREPAAWITLNVSCPNTAEGKTFEDKTALKELLDGITSERNEKDPPLLVKFSPDTDQNTVHDLVSICEDCNIQGYVIGNTTTRRDGLRTPGERIEKIGPGGLSGSPLFAGTLRQTSYFRNILPPDRILIACGGIDTPDKAVKLISAGANLLQLYTGLVYEGPALIQKINQVLVDHLNKTGAPSLRHLQHLRQS